MKSLGGLAQLVERITNNDNVGGSIPPTSTKKLILLFKGVAKLVDAIYLQNIS